MGASSLRVCLARADDRARFVAGVLFERQLKHLELGKRRCRVDNRRERWCRREHPPATSIAPLCSLARAVRCVASRSGTVPRRAAPRAAPRRPNPWPATDLRTVRATRAVASPHLTPLAPRHRVATSPSSSVVTATPIARATSSACRAPWVGRRQISAIHRDSRFPRRCQWSRYTRAR